MSNSYQRTIQEKEKVTFSYFASHWAMDEQDPELSGFREKEILNKLMKCYESGELKAYVGKDEQLWIKIVDIQEWARNNGNSPEFVLPEFNPTDDYIINHDDIVATGRSIRKLILDQEQPEKSFSTLEREKMLSLIIGMAIDSYGYDMLAKRNDATGNNKNSISSRLQQHGISIDADTIRKYLSEAQSLFGVVKPKKL